ncbi:LIM domain-containing protein WLIM2b-like [Carex rostrata]
MSGTAQKCKACAKTVYVMDQQLSLGDGTTFHKSCFRCRHCNASLQPSNFSSMDGVLYCKPHFQELFKEAPPSNNTFQSPAKTVEKKITPELTRSPSKAATMFCGTQEKCATCGKTAYPLEKVTVEEKAYHKSCFRCSHGGCAITPSNYAALEGVLYCKHHFKQLFKEKGSYSHILKSASMKHTAPKPEQQQPIISSTPDV